MRGRIARIVLYILLVNVVLGVSTVGFGVYLYRAPGALSEETTVLLKRGTSFNRAVKILHSNRVIRYPWLFTLTSLATGKVKLVQAGEYRFSPHISYQAVLKKLTTGDTVIRRVTIPEGLTVNHILDVLNHTEGLEGEVAPLPEEGALLPETYYFSYGDSKNDVIRRMSQKMEKTLMQLWEKRQNNLPFSTPEQALILASIVEKETGVAEERPRIAAVFINRLRQNMPLQSDPTVIYALTEGKVDLSRPLTLTDLKIPSPYNTYLVSGLPPHPIANPGKAAMEAVLMPLSTRELYFVANGSGGHDFAETLAEHNRNVALYRNVMKRAAERN